MITSIKDMRVHATLIAITLTLISSASLAYADPSPGSQTDPLNVVTGTTTIDLVLTGQAGGHTKGKVQVFEQNALITQPGQPLGSDCTLVTTTSPGTAKKWLLVNKDTTTAAEYTLPSGSMIRIPFGLAGEFTPTVSGGGSINSGNPVEWYDTQNAAYNTDAISQVVTDVHRWFQCGYDGSAPPPNKVQYDAANAFAIQAPVAGLIIPIDTTALLIGSVASSGLWMIPVLGAVGFAAFTIKKKLA